MEPVSVYSKVVYEVNLSAAPAEVDGISISFQAASGLINHIIANNMVTITHNKVDTGITLTQEVDNILYANYKRSYIPHGVATYRVAQKRSIIVSKSVHILRLTIVTEK